MEKAGAKLSAYLKQYDKTNNKNLCEDKNLHDMHKHNKDAKKMPNP